VVVLAVVIAGPLGGAAALAGAIGVSTAVASAIVIGGVSLIGNYAINALLPLPRPDAPGLSSSLSSVDANSPTYAFTATSQQNLARLGGKIPEWFGYHRVIPDLAATAWWEWVDGKQTLRQTLCCTKGELDVEKVDLGRVPITVYEEIEHEFFGPNETADLFEANVYQSPDVGTIELAAPNDLLPGDDGIFGPFVTVPALQATDRIGIDVSFPRGLFTQNGDGTLSPRTVQWRVEACEIDDAGAETGSWFTVANETFNATPGLTNVSTPEAGITGAFMGGVYEAANKLNSPLTVSYRYTLAASARYQVRLRRLDDKSTSALAGHDLAWSGLRGFLGGGDFGDVTILQIAITATASVNSSNARQIAVTGTRKLPVWDAENEEWTAPQPTRSIAAALHHVITGLNGGRQPESNYDRDGLLALDAIWTARGNYFDYYCSSVRGLWEFLQTIALCGRSVVYRQGHRIRFHRDQPQTMPVTGFSRENIAQHSLRIEYRLPSPEDNIDGMELKYFDKRTWNFNTLRKAFEGDGVPQRPLSRQLDGCTEIAVAQQELDYYVADYLLRPILAGFDTELEGGYPSYGDLVLLQHDSPRWGLSGRVIEWDADNLAVDLFAAPIWDFDDTLANPADNGWFARIRDRRGRLSAQVVIVGQPTSTRIVLNNAPVYDDGSPFDFTFSDNELPHVMFGKSGDEPVRVLFREMTPQQGYRRSVRCVVEDDAVHVN